MTDAFEQPAQEPPADPNTMPMLKGRYLDPNTGTSYQRVSNLLKFVKGDMYSLDIWKGRMVVRGLARRPDLLALAASLPEDDREQMNDVVSAAMTAGGADEGRNKGNALHRATERLDRGEHFDNILVPEPLLTDLRAYRDLVHSAGFIRNPKMVERTLVNPQGDYAGTADRIWRLHGMLCIVDAKTEKTPDRNGIHLAGQLALYANATHIWHEGGLVPLAELGIEINRDVGYVVHVRDGVARLIAVNLRRGFDVAQAALCNRALHREAASFLQDIPVIATAPPAADVVTAAVQRERTDELTAVVDPVQVNETADMQEMLLAEIRAAADRGRLAELYEIAQGYPGLWAAVEMEAMLRGQIVACVQRSMHDPATTARCACGWTRDRPA